jgi:dihydroorotate dehydrogenase electron transfer subunit
MLPPLRMLPPSHSLAVRDVEACGAYTLLRLRRDGAEAGVPGQFFMLRADPAPAGAYLPRPISAAWADDDELVFLLDIRGPGTRALTQARAVQVLGPLGKGFEIAPGAALLVGGGIGAAILPWLVRLLPEARVLLGFRTEAHAVCAGLVDPGATVVVEPELVTEPLARLLPGFEGTVYACGPDAMLGAVAALAAEHGVACQLAMEAAMACGFGACYGCAVRIDGMWKRLCVEGPVVEASRAVA